MSWRRKKSQPQIVVPEDTSTADAIAALRSHLAAAVVDAPLSAPAPDPDNDSVEELTAAKARWERLAMHLRGALDVVVGLAAARAESTEPEAKKRRKESLSIDDVKIGSLVAYRLPRSADDEWIMCQVTKVIQEGQRYEVRDAEPDDSGPAGKLFKAGARELIPLPSPDDHLAVIPSGTVVLAQYPETTAFYRATVTGHTRERKYRLQFEGEEEADKETEVPDHLVVNVPP